MPRNAESSQSLQVGGSRRSSSAPQCKYLNNIIEQDHRTVKKQVWLAKGYGSFHGPSIRYRCLKLSRALFFLRPELRRSYRFQWWAVQDLNL